MFICIVHLWLIRLILQQYLQHCVPFRLIIQAMLDKQKSHMSVLQNLDAQAMPNQTWQLLKVLPMLMYFVQNAPIAYVHDDSK